jgi:uncharacterized membrane protein YphA (DoxX/SURF4 family)
MKTFCMLGRLILSGIFLYSAYRKLRSPWLAFAGTLSSYELLSDNLLEPLARTLPWCELGLGAALVSGMAVRWFSLLSSLLLGTFFAVMVRSYAIGLPIDCGCFGAGGDPIGLKTLARDFGFLALAIALTVAAFRRSALQQKEAHGESIEFRNGDRRQQAGKAVPEIQNKCR